MWRRLPLRTRLLLPLAAMFVVALLLGTIALHVFATEQLAEESGPATRSAKAVAEAVNAALQASDSPRQTLEAFARTLGSAGTIQFRPAGPVAFSEKPIEVRTPLGKVPNWFIELLSIPQLGAAFPVLLDGKHAGDIVFVPDVSAELYEKWIGFLAMVLGAAVLTAATGAIAWFSVGTALRPLQDLADGLTRIRNGDYGKPIPAAGPPEIRRSCEQANDLAQRLHALSADNRDLLHKIVSLQDDERRDIARELHDELGPLLFGIRAGAVALRDAVPQGDAVLTAPLENILQSVEALQQENRRILDHLRPLYIEELGLTKSIETLLQKARAQAPAVSLTSRIDPRLNELDGPLSQTVYRVIQEGVTNALRHAGASSINVRALLDEDELTIETSDDGVGFEEVKFGRGLTGMHERVRALSGTFQLVREAGKSVVRCRLPITARAAGENASTGDRAGS
jgi:two-component system, NarL family, sensor histidine kinase UhpB